jgi:hypothetical protein
VTVTGSAANLIWSGGTSAWDVNTTSNWNAGTEKFLQADAVTFDDSAANKTVTLAGHRFLPAR